MTDLPISAEEQEEKAKGLKDGTATDRSVRTETDRHALRTGEIQDLHHQGDMAHKQSQKRAEKCSTRTGKEINSAKLDNGGKRTNRRYRNAHWEKQSRPKKHNKQKPQTVEKKI